MKEKVIIVGGATASGKSDFAVTLAKSINSEIISCDSMQIFKGMDIGTAKITYNEMNNVKHHMLDIVEPTENFSVSQYVTRARKIISSLNASGKGSPHAWGGGRPIHPPAPYIYGTLHRRAHI